MPQAQTILVTGCSSGIGRATALEGARRGHRVFATARDTASLAEMRSIPSVSILHLDVTDAGSISGAVQTVLSGAGGLDAVVNNAGYGQYGAVEDVPLEDWRSQFEVGVFGAIEVSRAALPTMREQRHGTIVFVSSVAGKISIPFAGPYCAAKHALEAVADALRVEVAPFGVRIVLIEPGPVQTRFEERARAQAQRFLSRPGPYAAFYAGAEHAMEHDFQMGKIPPEPVARVILDAIESGKPKTRYPMTSMTRIFFPLKRLLPDRFFDWRMRKALRLPDRV